MGCYGLSNELCQVEIGSNGFKWFIVGSNGLHSVLVGYCRLTRVSKWLLLGFTEFFLFFFTPPFGPLAIGASALMTGPASRPMAGPASSATNQWPLNAAMRFERTSTWSSQQPISIEVFYRVLPSFTEFWPHQHYPIQLYLVLPSFTWFSLVCTQFVPSFTWFYQFCYLLNFTGFYLVFHGSTQFYLVLPSFTQIYLVLLVF